MDKVVAKFKTFEDADRANRLYYETLTAKERIDLLIQLIDDHYGTEHRLERVPGSARIVFLEDFCQK